MNKYIIVLSVLLLTGCATSKPIKTVATEGTATKSTTIAAAIINKPSIQETKTKEGLRGVEFNCPAKTKITYKNDKVEYTCDRQGESFIGRLIGTVLGVLGNRR